MNKNNRKETINHFIKWYCYVTSTSKGYNEIAPQMLEVLDNYIEGKHYDFSPFTEIKEKKWTHKT